LTSGRKTQLVDPTPERQARDKFRGYAYQAYQTILAWLRCGSDEEILCEFGEDIAIVKRDAAGDISEAELDQIKHQQASLTLGTETAAKAINSLLLHMKENPSVSLFLRVCTIAGRGREQGINWRYANCGLDLWDMLRDGDIVTDGSVELLRRFLSRHSQLSEEARSFINNASDSEIKSELIGRIFWDTGQQSYTEVQAEINRLLAANPRPVTDPDEVEAIVNRLWRHVTDRMAAASSIPLTKPELEDLLTRETLVQVDRSTLREMATNVSHLAEQSTRMESMLNPLIARVAGSSSIRLSITSETMTWLIPPPLPDMCSLRTGRIEHLRSLLGDNTVIWIHGWTGSGKSTVANLLVRAVSESVRWCNFQNLEGFSLVGILGTLVNELTHLNERQCVVVCDDLNIEDLNTSATESIRRMVDLARSKHWKMIITSQQECPSRLRSEIASSVCQYIVPGLERGEIKELIRSVGLTKEPDASNWATYIAAMTAGHPLLACARIIHAQQTGWKRSEDELLSEPRLVERVKAEARGSVAASIASDDARELARRLSVVMGTFSREFALRLGSAQPSLKEPGRAFDSLEGPWIERVAVGRLALSPMLAGFAGAEFGDEILPKYFGIAAQAWLGERVFSPTQLIHAVVSAVIGENETLLVKLSVWLAQENVEVLVKFAKHIGLLSRFPLTMIDLSPSLAFHRDLSFGRHR
jgi:hypothetical protein